MVHPVQSPPELLEPELELLDDELELELLLLELDDELDELELEELLELLELELELELEELLELHSGSGVQDVQLPSNKQHSSSSSQHSPTKCVDFFDTTSPSSQTSHSPSATQV